MHLSTRRLRQSTTLSDSLQLIRCLGVWTICLYSKAGKNIYQAKGATQKECLDEMFARINDWWGSL